MVLPEEERDKIYAINPMLHINSKVKNKYYPTLKNNNEEIYIKTKHVDTLEDYIVTSTATTTINVQYNRNGKIKIGTVGIIAIIDEELPMIWSGSIVEMSKTIFVVGAVTRFEGKSMIKIIAYTVSTHDVSIELNDDEE